MFSSFCQRIETRNADGCGLHGAKEHIQTNVQGNEILIQNMATCVRTTLLQVNHAILVQAIDPMFCAELPPTVEKCKKQTSLYRDLKWN